MALIKKLALGSIFISILCIFGMSHNASALTTTFSLNNYVIKSSSGQVSVDCTYDDYNLNNSQSLSYVANCSPIMTNSSTIALRRLVSHQTYNLKKDEIIEFYLLISTPEGQGSTLQGAPDVKNFTFEAGLNGAYLLGFEQVSVSDFQQINSNYTLNVNNQIDGFYFYSNESLSYVYRLTYLIRKDLDNVQIGLNTNSTNTGFFITRWNNNYANYRTLSFYLSNITIYDYSGSDENKEVEQKTQEAVDDSQAAGSDSSSAASSGGANLLTAITGFFNVITSAQPTNCRFNAPLNTYFGNQNLNVDLCALELPSGIGALTSIIAIGILIPFAIHMFNKFIALFRSFQS